MLKELLPPFIRRSLKAAVRQVVRRSSEGTYFPSHFVEDDYCIPLDESELARPENRKLPIPPQRLWLYYGPDVRTYLASGREHVSRMVQILENGGFEVRSADRVLEFGCAAGRMIRHLVELAPGSELWGVDISAEHIRWCINNLTPDIHFATTSVLPHLPFEDRFFNLVFCGSIFTHIEDVQETWLLELGRVLQPGGKLYITVHDEHTVELLQTRYRDHELAKAMQQHPVYRANMTKFHMIVIGRGAASQVFYNSEYLKSIIPPCLRWESITPEAYGYQSAVVLEKVETRLSA